MTTRLYKVGEPVEIEVLLEGGADPNRPDLPPVSVTARILDSEGNQIGRTISPAVDERKIKLNVPPKLVQIPGNYNALFTIQAGEKPPQDTPVWFIIEGDVVPKDKYRVQTRELHRTQKESMRTQEALQAAEAREKAEKERVALYANRDAISSDLLRKLRRKFILASSEISKFIKD